jgi:hypothetical protein
MNMNCKHVSASEAGDYYQVLFEKQIDDDDEYFLIQQQFEFPSDDKCYIETQDEEFVGHYKIKEARINPNKFYLEIQRKQNSKITINFETTPKSYKDIRRVLKIIIPNISEG